MSESILTLSTQGCLPVRDRCIGFQIWYMGPSADDYIALGGDGRFVGTSAYTRSKEGLDRDGHVCKRKRVGQIVVRS
jgi:hypothetical protein